MIDADLFGKVQAVGTDIRGDDRGGTGRSRDRGCEESCWTTAGDQDRLSREIFDQGGVDSVAERFLEAGEFRWNSGRSFPEDRFRQDHILRERAVAIDTEDSVILAHMRLPGATLKTMTTGEVGLGGDVIP